MVVVINLHLSTCKNVDGGKRGQGDVVWSWGDLCFGHSVIHLSAYMMGWGVVMVGLTCAFISQ